MATATVGDNIRRALQGFDFKGLFIEELGWDAYRGMPLAAMVGGETYTLRLVAEKRGMAALLCEPDARGGIPDYQTRKAIETQMAKLAHEHVIIYADTGATRQIWQWVKRQQGRPNAYREWTFTKGQTGEALAQRLRELIVALDEEEMLTLADVTDRAKRAFDVDRVTKKFYDRFKTEHAAFLKLIAGIADEDQREWYASLMLNRLMFTYFVQKKGFLAGDADYLRTRLGQVQARYGTGNFHTFYRDFLLRFFHEGLGLPKAQRTPDLAALIGDIPYVNGGLFELHQIEAANRSIAIPDEAFEAVFDFFDGYIWHLDDRPLHDDKEINPDVLGYIFEKYINQKQMGAYYTKEDITGYIGRNTILPYLFDAARKDCQIAFERDGEVWRRLRDDPDAYIYEAVRKGVDEPLPPEIAAGVDDVAKRGGWNRPAPEPYALPTETWREHMARRTRCLELRAKLAAGEVTQINDLITYNLDIERFARDVIDLCEGPELVRAFWKALTTITILDPTCGSGAFLFAALNILEPLYEACLERMESFVAEFDRQGLTKNGPRFREAIQQLSEHANRRYFILKTIIVNNLYGVDIMAEACEIAKLRLFLKLVAQVQDVKRLEPLPDIDFNIQAGNTLVGFATLDAVRDALTLDPGGRTRKLLLDTEDEAALKRINEGAEIAGRAFEQFRKMQSDRGMNAHDFHEAKRNLRQRLDALRGELDRYLAREYGVDPDNLFAFGPWRESHQPFHWFVEFYDIVQGNGGFDVIIGNPPYVEYSKVRNSYTIRNTTVQTCGNLYTFILEHCFKLLEQGGRFGMIVPVSLLCTERMIPVQQLVLNIGHSWASSYDMRPSSLFSGVSQRLTILLCAMSGERNTVHLGGYRRWKEEEREALFANQHYTECLKSEITLGYMPKIADSVERSISSKLQGAPLASFETPRGANTVFVHRIVRYFVKAVDFLPHFWNEAEGNKKSEDYKPFLFVPQLSEAIGAIINSSAFYWFWHSYSDGFHCGYRDVRPFGLNHPLEPETLAALTNLNREVMANFKENANRRIAFSKATGRVEYDEIYPKHSKSIIDKIDRVLAKHYGFTDEELDFIINYDIKYRMGQDNGDDGENGNGGEE